MLRDLRVYFNKLQLDYNKTVEIAKKVNKEIEEGLVTEEQRNNFETYFNAVKTNYDRVSYIMHLISLPPKFIQDIQMKKATRDWEKQRKEFEKRQADLASIQEENKENIEAAEELYNSISSEGE